MADIRISPVHDFTRLGPRWQDLERRAQGSFFQSWIWTGCLAPERFPDPLLVEATEAGRTVALGLFNRVRRRAGLPTLYLSETGSAENDCPYIEQNGFLTEAGREDELTAACLRPLLASHDVVLSGVNVHHLAAIQAAAGSVRTVRSQASPFVDLAALRRSGADYLSKRSANTRQQLRRSDRFYQGRGPITLSPAASLSMAHDRLDRLADMHQATWQARGQPGSFGRPFFARFHHALIEAGYPGRNLTLLEVSAGAEAIGILYNFIWKGRMSAYQSGFVYPGETAAKPGLTCHRQAIEHALSQGHDIYDFLAGEDRYKRSLADQSHQQLWLEAGPRWSPRQLSHSLAQWLRRRKSRIAATARSS